MCIATPRDSIQSVASSSKKISKRAMVNNNASTTTTSKKVAAKLSNVSGMTNYDTSGRLNIS